MQTEIETRHADGLRKGVLPFSETLAQSIANIAPTATPAVNMAFVVGASGSTAWFTYLIATVSLLFVSLCINQFASRSATPGSLYSYVSKGLGSGAGFATGWALLMAYLATAFAVIAGFGMYAGDLLKSFGGPVLPPYVYYAFCAITIFCIVFKDVSLSARLMLGIEAVSLCVITVLALLAMSKKGFDSSTIQLSSMTADGLRTGLVFAIFSYVGFESATAMGGEAKDPLKTVPKAVWMSTAISGSFFMLMGILMVSAFASEKTELAKQSAPLHEMATIAGLPSLGLVASFLAMFSLFACALACTTAVSRILMTMSRDGFIHKAVSTTHHANETPHTAAAACSVLLFVVPAMMSIFGIPLGDVYGLNGTIATYGFLVSYILIPIASVVYLGKIKQSSPMATVTAAIAIVTMLIPVYGSIAPYPAAPYGYLPIVFSVFMAVGGVCWMLSKKSMGVIAAAPEMDLDDGLEAA